MGEWHDLGKHARRAILTAIHNTPELMSLVAAALEATGADIDEDTRIELQIDAIRARVAPPRGSDGSDG